MKKLTTIAIATMLAATSVTAFAQVAAGDSSALPQQKKMMIKLTAVDTSGTRHQKTWVPPAKPLEMTTKPYSVAQIMQATPEEAARMRQKNEDVEDKQRQTNAQIAYENWKAADDHMKGIQAKLEGNVYGRQIILALDKFAGSAGTYFDPDCIEFFHRMDMDEGQKEQFMQDMSDPEVLAAPYFLKLIFDDPREESGVVQLDSIQQIKMTKYTQTVTYEVQDLQGKIAAAGNVRRDKQIRTSNAVQRGGTDGNELVDVLEEALDEVAKAINDKFVARISISLIGPRGDEEFYPEAATITVDGDAHQADEEFSVLKGSHVLDVVMDGYKLPGCPKKLLVSSSQAYKFPMTSSMCEFTVNVKGPAGDAAFDPDAASITLSGEEEVYLSNGMPTKVPHGKYTLSVEVDGCQPVTKPVVVGGPKQNLVVPVK